MILYTKIVTLTRNGPFCSRTKLALEAREMEHKLATAQKELSEQIKTGVKLAAELKGAKVQHAALLVKTKKWNDLIQGRKAEVEAALKDKNAQLSATKARFLFYMISI